MKPWPMAELVPHAGDMVLLDSVAEMEGDRIVCLKTVRADELFAESDGALPAWLGVELMAQAIAAWSGCVARAEHQPVQLGFLLGTRHYACNVDAFPPGTRLRVEAERAFHDEHGMGVFHCRIDAEGVHAEARLNVYRPPDADAFFQRVLGDTSHG